MKQTIRDYMFNNGLDPADMLDMVYEIAAEDGRQACVDQWIMDTYGDEKLYNDVVNLVPEYLDSLTDDVQGAVILDHLIGGVCYEAEKILEIIREQEPVEWEDFIRKHEESNDA